MKRKHSDKEEKELCMKVKTTSEIISQVGAKNFTRAIRETRDEM